MTEDEKYEFEDFFMSIWMNGVVVGEEGGDDDRKNAELEIIKDKFIEFIEGINEASN